MLSDRLAVSILLIPVAMWVVVLGGLVYLGTMVALMIAAVFEYDRLFRAGGCRPALPVLVTGVALFVAAAYFPLLNSAQVLVPFAVLAALTWHLIDYERGAPASGTDFVVTLGGIIYLGGLGSYFVALRNVPDGLWWFIATLSAVWIVDSGAYVAGRTWGRHKFSPRLSPKKTWEGYVGGIVTGLFFSGLLSVAWQFGAGPTSLFTWQKGAVLGGIIGVVSPVGDLGVSMIKRQVGLKDAGDVMPGHGGVLDRIDSWLVAVTLGYYFALWLGAL